MLLDVLGGLDELKICVAYEIDGRQTTQFPSQIADLEKAVPVYETLPGWREELDGVRAERWRILIGRDAEELDARVRAAPEQAYERDFFDRFESEVGWRLGR